MGDHIAERSFRVVDFAVGRLMMLINLFRLEAVKLLEHSVAGVVAGMKEMITTLGIAIVLVLLGGSLVLVVALVGYKVLVKALDL